MPNNGMNSNTSNGDGMSGTNYSFYQTYAYITRTNSSYTRYGAGWFSVLDSDGKSIRNTVGSFYQIAGGGQNHGHAGIAATWDDNNNRLLFMFRSYYGSSQWYWHNAWAYPTGYSQGVSFARSPYGYEQQNGGFHDTIPRLEYDYASGHVLMCFNGKNKPTYRGSSSNVSTTDGGLIFSWLKREAGYDTYGFQYDTTQEGNSSYSETYDFRPPSGGRAYVLGMSYNKDKGRIDVAYVGRNTTAGDDTGINMIGVKMQSATNGSWWQPETLTTNLAQFMDTSGSYSNKYEFQGSDMYYDHTTKKQYLGMIDYSDSSKFKMIE